MMNKLVISGILFAVFSLSACTDAERAALGSYGSEAKVTCYSGGNVVFEDVSTGKVVAGTGEEGIVFKSKTTGSYVRAFADCIVLEKR
jgi:hypothetical protein